VRLVVPAAPGGAIDVVRQVVQMPDVRERFLALNRLMTDG